MGLLDAAIGMFGGQESGNSQSALLQTLLSMLSNGQGGGLSGLVEQFNNAGLGDIIGSWIGTGENLPISADQIQNALGNGQLSQLAESTGLSQGDAAQQLTQLLPGLVDKLTPNGELPQGGAFGGLDNIGAILGQFTGRG